MTLVEVKQLLNITHSDLDTYLVNMLSLLIAYVEEECNRSFYEDGVLHLPAGVRLFIVKAIEYNLHQAGVSSSSFAEESLSITTDFPESILRGLRRHRKVRFV